MTYFVAECRMKAQDAFTGEKKKKKAKAKFGSAPCHMTGVCEN